MVKKPDFIEGIPHLIVFLLYFKKVVDFHEIGWYINKRRSSDRP
jgi:hypothetical protein